MHAATRCTLLAIALVLAGACGGSDGLAPPVVDRPAAPQAEAVDLTLEEAGHLAAGQLIEIYSLDADPFPASVESQIVDYQGQQVWLLDITADFADNGQRLQHQWRMWIGTPIDGPPAVLRAQQAG